MRRRRNKTEPGLEVDMGKIVTPFLDVSFQLLFFFMVFYKPSSMEGQMELSLPTQAEKQAKDMQDVDPNVAPDRDLDPEFPPDLTVVVKTQHDGVNDGKISQVTVQEKSGSTDVTSLDWKKGLREHLKKVRETADNKDTIKVQADSGLKWGFVVEVMDECRKAEFRNVSFAEPPDRTR